MELLSDDLKKSLGVDGDDGNNVVMTGSKKKKKKTNEVKKSKSALKKEASRKSKSAKRMRSAADLIAEREKLYERISASKVQGDVKLKSSKTLRRKDPKVRLPWDIVPGNDDDDDVDDVDDVDGEEDEDRLRMFEAKLDEEDNAEAARFESKRSKIVPSQQMLMVPDEGSLDETIVAEEGADAKNPKKAVRPDPPRKSQMSSNPSEQMQEWRSRLPATQWEAEVMEKLQESDVVVVCGPTGSGKTTQVPQWLWEHGYRQWGMIAVTQPRRVAARMVSERVAEEMGVEHGMGVCYHVRHEKCMRGSWDDCRVLFVTDGLLLALLKEDVLLEQYSCIVIDEAHERTLGTDVLLGVLSRIVPLRRRRWETGQSETPPLKLVIMSATLALEQLLSKTLFPITPPVVSMEGRQFSVDIHWQRITPEDMVGALDVAVKTVSSIHRKLPRGTVLVFVPGKREIQYCMNKLKKMFPDDGEYNLEDEDEDDGYEQNEEDKAAKGASDERTRGGIPKQMFLIALHSGQEPSQQRQAFRPPPTSNHRMVIVATNIAECSLTIPDVRYVVDTGYARERVWGSDGDGVFATRRISQASATQRTGRAGRTLGGHCYRIYSQPLYAHHMDPHDVPHSLRVPADELVLSLVAMGIARPERFPLPSPPSVQQFQEAQVRLARLGLLRCEEAPLRLTLLGAEAASLPLPPSASRALLSLPKGKPSIARLASFVCACWSVGHLLWTAEKDKSLPPFAVPANWNNAVSACEVLYAVCALQSMIAFPTGALELRRSLGMSASSVDAVFSLADQTLQRWQPDLAAAEGRNFGDRMIVPPPSNEDLVMLQQALFGGVLQNLARREKQHYIRLLDGLPMHLHPEMGAPSFKTARSPWISCLDIQTPSANSQRYAMYAFSINPAWIPLISLASPDMRAPPLLDISRLDTSTAQYDPQEDAVSCVCSPRFGPLVSSLPTCRVILHSHPSLFGCLILEGHVFPSLRPLVPHLLIQPRSLLESVLTAAQRTFLKSVNSVTRVSQLRVTDAFVTQVVVLYVPAARDVAKREWTKISVELKKKNKKQ